MQKFFDRFFLSEFEKLIASFSIEVVLHENKKSIIEKKGNFF